MEREVYKFPVPAYGKRKTSKGSWRMVLEGNTLTLLDEDREEVERWRGQEVLVAVKGPSFVESRKVYGVYLDGDLVDLNLDLDAKNALQEMLDRIMLQLHPDMPAKAVQYGLIMMAGGVVVFIIGLLITMQRIEEGRTYFLFGIMLAGAIMFFGGIGRIMSRSKWKRLQAKMDAEDKPRRRRRSRDDEDDEDE